MPTFPDGTVRVEHAWKRFRADRTLPMFQDQIQLFAKWLRGYRRPYRWVLRDINLHVEPGKTYGIIGVNGSGKSTLLKMICQTTFPSAGSVTLARAGGRTARGALGDPPRPVGAPERLPLRQHPGHVACRRGGAVRRHHRLRRDRRRRRPAGEVLLDGHGDPTGIRHRRLPGARHPARRRGPGRGRRPLPAEVPRAHQPGRRQRHDAVLRVPRPPHRRGGVRPGHVAGRQLRARRRPGARRGQPVPGLGRGAGRARRRRTDTACAS